MPMKRRASFGGVDALPAWVFPTARCMVRPAAAPITPMAAAAAMEAAAPLVELKNEDLSCSQRHFLSCQHLLGPSSN
jgi:hypothetical protein